MVTLDLIDHASLHQWLQCATEFKQSLVSFPSNRKLFRFLEQCWLANSEPTIHNASSTLPPQYILCAATDVGMHGLLASQLCYHSVLPPSLCTLWTSSRFLHY